MIDSRVGNTAPKHTETPGPIFGWPRCRTIISCEKEKGPLLKRYFLIRTALFGLYLHHLIASDEDRALHDHPFSFFSLLLSRGYWEHTDLGRFWRPRFSILWRPAKWRHRLELEGVTWTLVVHFRRHRTWGFWNAGIFTKWQDYIKEWCD